jgi:G3E family GTPase
LADSVVLINELGSVPIDHYLVREAREETVLLASGCVCCTLRTDLVDQLTSLLAQRAGGELPRFRRVLLETTGLADPAPIVQTLLRHPELSDAFYLDGIVCTVDAQLGAQTLDSQPEAQKQVALADRLLLTKLDLVDRESATALVTRLRRENPSAPVAHTSGTEEDVRLLLDTGHLDTRPILYARAAPAHDHLHDVRSLSLTLSTPVDFAQFSLWLAMLTQLWAERILRVKAVVSARGEPTPIAVQAVQHVVYPPLNLPPIAELAGRTHVVVLTRGLGERELDEIERSLRELAA